jgi:hypothetical protein
MTSSQGRRPSIARLADGLAGQVIGPGDPSYDDLRAVMPGGFDRRPAAIVRTASASDVSAVVRFAAEHGLELAVRSGGHSGAGHGTTDGGIVLDVRGLKDVEVDPGGRTAWAGSGLTAAEYTAAAAKHGLATGLGDTGSVGLGGITLGGGIGFLVRKLGLTIDSLVAAEMVTADGELRHIDANSESDLFWAIRGGGGNFGVVTRFKLRLHAIDRVVGGMLVLPATPEVVAGFIAACEAASDDLSAIGNVMNCPPLPFVPEEHHGSFVLLAILCHAGPVGAGEEAMRPFRALAEPLADMLRPMAYPEIYPDFDMPADLDYHPEAVSRSMFLERVDAATAGLVIDQLAASDASLRVVQLRVLGGAMARVASDATAFAHRASRIMANVASFIDAPDERPRRAAWVSDLADALHQGDDGVYVNFLEDEGPARVRAAYPGPTWDRLVGVKRRYDPTNLFRLNQNIPPTG